MIIHDKHTTKCDESLNDTTIMVTVCGPTLQDHNKDSSDPDLNNPKQKHKTKRSTRCKRKREYPLKRKEPITKQQQYKQKQQKHKAKAL